MYVTTPTNASRGSIFKIAELESNPDSVVAGLYRDPEGRNCDWDIMMLSKG